MPKFTPKSARQLANFTQSEIAHEMGICKQTYGKLEKNPELFTVAAAVKFCSIVGLTIDEVSFLPNNSTISRVS